MARYRGSRGNAKVHTSGVCYQRVLRGEAPDPPRWHFSRRKALSMGARWPAERGGAGLPGRQSPTPFLVDGFPVVVVVARGKGARMSENPFRVYTRDGFSDGEGKPDRRETGSMTERPPRVYTRGEVLGRQDPRCPTAVRKCVPRVHMGHDFRRGSGFRPPGDGNHAKKCAPRVHTGWTF